MEKEKKIKVDNLYLMTGLNGGVATLAIYLETYGSLHTGEMTYETKTQSLLNGKELNHANSQVLDGDNRRWRLIENMGKYSKEISIETLQRINQSFIKFQYEQLKKQDNFVDEVLMENLIDENKKEQVFAAKKIKLFEEMLNY